MKKNEIIIFKLILIFSSIILIFKFKKFIYLYINKKSFLFNIYYKKNEYIDNSNKQVINITLSLDNNHIYQTLVVMTSVLANNDKNHLVIFYLLLPDDFDSTNFKIFESLKLKYQLIIYYYYIPNLFNSLKKWRNNSTAIYFKLLIPILIPNIKRIIHLDGDTLVFKDLWELFNLPFEDNFISSTNKNVYF